MPRPKDPDRDGLLPDVCFFLAHGRLPERAARGGGLVEAFTLKYSPDAVRERELARLWQEHRQQIEAAAAPNEPWVAKVLRDPQTADGQQDEQET